MILSPLPQISLLLRGEAYLQANTDLHGQAMSQTESGSGTIDWPFYKQPPLLPNMKDWIQIQVQGCIQKNKSFLTPGQLPNLWTAMDCSHCFVHLLRLHSKPVWLPGKWRQKQWCPSMPSLYFPCEPEGAPCTPHLYLIFHRKLTSPSCLAVS